MILGTTLEIQMKCNKKRLSSHPNPHFLNDKLLTDRQEFTLILKKITVNL